MKFKIVTPERIMIETEADSVTLPTQMGEVTILPHHVPMVSNLKPGEIQYKSQGQTNFFAVSGGVIEVKNNEAIVLADTAEAGPEIDEQRAQEARDWAQRMMAEKRHDAEAFAEVAAIFERNMARIKVVQKHRTHTHRNLESGTIKQ